MKGSSLKDVVGCDDSGYDEDAAMLETKNVDLI